MKQWDVLVIAPPAGRGGVQAIAAARLGARVAVLGHCKPDRHAWVQLLENEGVSTRFVRFDEGPVTSLNVHGAFDAFAQSRIALIHGELLPAALQTAVGLAAREQLRVVLDPSPGLPIPREVMRGIEIIAASSGDSRRMTGITLNGLPSAYRTGSALLERGAHAAFVEDGEGGHLMMLPDREVRIPGFAIKRVDAALSENALFAALASALADGRDHLHAALFACATAALAGASQVGPASLPLRDEVFELLNRNNRGLRWPTEENAA